MKQIKEVTVFSNGDSDKISTWSNVPFFFTQTLISKGIKVNKIDLSPSPLLCKIYNKTIYLIVKRISKKTTYNYFRSLIHFINIRYRIKLALLKFPAADANIFLTFSFSSVKLTNTPSILFGDWTYDHFFRTFEKRKPDFFERSSIKREDRMINNSSFVFPLFPSVAQYMEGHYQNKNIHYLGNVINSLYEPSEEVISRKTDSHDLLFIGNKKYIEGAICLIKTSQLLRSDYPNLSVHIIGMNESDFEELPEGVHCYGYLDKAKESEKKLYYSLLENAKIFINTTDGWGAFSASVEAMYFYTPVIVSPYKEFLTTFGNNLNFGSYCEYNAPETLKREVLNMLTSKSYGEFCSNAHNSVKDFTWSSYIEKMLTFL